MILIAQFDSREGCDAAELHLSDAGCRIAETPCSPKILWFEVDRDDVDVAYMLVFESLSPLSIAEMRSIVPATNQDVNWYAWPRESIDDPTYRRYPTRRITKNSIIVYEPDSTIVGITDRSYTKHDVQRIAETGVYLYSAGSLADRFIDWETLRASWRVLVIRRGRGTGSNHWRVVERWYLHRIA